MSICAQSWESTPPAPAWMARIALRRSCGPERASVNSRSATLRVSSASSSLRVSRTESSLSSIASAARSSAASALPSSVRHWSTSLLRAASSFILSCARWESCQNDSTTDSRSRASMRFSLSARSKTHHDLGYFFPERRQCSFEFLHGSNHLFRPTEVVERDSSASLVRIWPRGGRQAVLPAALGPVLKLQHGLRAGQGEHRHDQFEHQGARTA